MRERVRREKVRMMSEIGKKEIIVKNEEEEEI